MINSIGFSASQMLNLESNTTINSTSTFNAQEAYENTFEDILLEQTSAEDQKNNYTKPNLSNNIELIDIKNINQFENLTNNNEQNNKSHILKGFEAINYKNGISKYIMECIK